jgi:hypothetical protein
MMERLRKLTRLTRTPPGDDPPEPAPAFKALRLFSAELLLSTGANATLHYLRARSGPAHPADGDGSAPPWTAEAVAPHSRARPGPGAWAPLVLGSLGCAAQATLALRPSDRALLATRVLGGLILGVGAAGAADALRASIRGEAPFTFAPLLFGYTGLIGFLLDRQETAVAEEEEALTRRSRILDRLVPERRTRIERIVVHV